MTRNKTNRLRVKKADFAVVNSRIIIPKIESIVDSFTELDLAFMTVSETWLKDDSLSDQILRDLELGHGIGAICVNRKPRNGRNPGGGVAVLYKKSRIQLKAFPTRREGCEIVVGRGKFRDNTHPTYVISAYLPPGLRRAALDKNIEALRNAVTKVKLKDRDPMIFIGGDFNNYNIDRAFEEFLDVRCVPSQPTRGDERLDLLYSNVTDWISKGKSLPPLDAVGGAPSDHNVLAFTITVPHVHMFEWVTYRAREMTEKNKKKFHEEYCGVDWTGLLSSIECPSEMTNVLHGVTQDLIDRCFPEKTHKIRSTDDPWIDDNIRRAIRRRKRCYKNHRRSNKWVDLKMESDNLIKESKAKYYADAVEKLKANGTQVPYRILKELAVADRPKAWTVNAVRPSLSDRDLANELADYFARITDEFEPLGDFQPPVTYAGPFREIQPHEVAQRIRSQRKVKSAVEGDLLPSLSNQYSDITAIPATRIINYSISKGTWPTPWLLETQTAISKEDAADDFDQLRNLSCTNALSKVLESFVLEKLQSEVTVRQNQYGDLKGSGTPHFLTKCWDYIMRALDEPESAVSLLSVDFSKAFNRMCHFSCVRSLVRAGASSESLAMVTAFLNGRRMRFKVGNTYSDVREVRGGSPQGTKLGGFLFVVTINEVEDSCDFTPPELTETAGVEEENDLDELGLQGLAGRVSAIRRFDSGVAVASTPCKGGVLKYMDSSGMDASITTTAGLRATLVGPTMVPLTLKYIDDVNVAEQHNTRDAVSTFSQTREKKSVFAGECDARFKNIMANAGKTGMRVNLKKTKLLCLSAALHSEVSSHIEDGQGGTIESQDSLMVLGFAFDTKPSMSAHIKLIEKKYNVRSWVVRHLKQAGVPNKDIVTAYASAIRSSIEYAAQVYHPMLTYAQSECLERMQRRCLKIIYGYKMSYTEALETSGLNERREVTFERFTMKTSQSEKFDRWFPRHQRCGYGLRSEKEFEELHANTDRLYKSPLYAMRRALNK